MEQFANNYKGPIVTFAAKSYIGALLDFMTYFNYPRPISNKIPNIYYALTLLDAILSDDEDIVAWRKETNMGEEDIVKHLPQKEDYVRYHFEDADWNFNLQKEGEKNE